MDIFVTLILTAIGILAAVGLTGWLYSLTQPYPEEWPTEIPEEIEEEV